MKINLDFDESSDEDSFQRLTKMQGESFSAELEAYPLEREYGRDERYKTRYSQIILTNITDKEGTTYKESIVIEFYVQDDKMTPLFYLIDEEGKLVTPKRMCKARLPLWSDNFEKTLKNDFKKFCKDPTALLNDLSIYISNHENEFVPTLIAEDIFQTTDETPYELRVKGYNVTESDPLVQDFLRQVNKENGGNVIQFLEEKIPHLILDEKSNIMKKVLMCFSVMVGRGSYFDMTIGDAQEGKSLMIETVLDYFIPSEYIETMNEATDSFFINQAIADPYLYSRKIINLGDLGNDEKYKKMENIFDVLKILTTEKAYETGKSRKGENDWEATPINLEAESILVSYSSVRESKSSNTEQLQSRGIISTPNHEKSRRTYSFNNKKKVKMTRENAYFEKAVKDLEGFKRYLLYLTNKCYEMSQDVTEDGVLIHQRLQFYNIFEKLFYRLGASDEVGIRNANLLTQLLEALTLMNWEKSLKFIKEVSIGENEKERIIYVLPRADDLLDFIRFVFDSAGINPRVKELVKALRDNFIIIDESRGDEVTYVSSNPLTEHIESTNPRLISDALLTMDKSETIVSMTEIAIYEHLYDTDSDKDTSLGTLFKKNETILSEFYDRYGLNERNKKHNKNIEKKLGESSDEVKRVDLTNCYKPLFLFTNTNLKRRLAVKGIKGVDDLGNLLSEADKMGYLDKFPQKMNRANVYYLTQKAREIEEDNIFTSDDLEDGIHNLEALKVDPIKTNSERLFSDKEIKQVKKEFEDIVKDGK